MTNKVLLHPHDWCEDEPDEAPILVSSLHERTTGVYIPEFGMQPVYRKGPKKPKPRPYPK